METMFELHDAVASARENCESSVFKCKRISQSIRGLTDATVEHPYLDGDVAGCSYRADERECKDLVNTSGCETLDWCRTARRLQPMHVNAEGNNLEYAASTALWGFSTGAGKVLRRLIYVSLIECGESKYRNRWQRQCQSNGFQLDNQQSSWNEVVKSAMYGRRAVMEQEAVRSLSAERESASTAASPLADPLQVFVLANVLRRPIVVLSTSDDVRGVYLPVLFEAAVCVKHPIVLSYYQSRFVPLVGSSGPSSIESAMDFVPLVTSEFEPLRVLFLLDAEEHLVGDLEQRHMDLVDMNLTDLRSVNYIPSARLKYRNLDYDFVPTIDRSATGMTSGRGSGIVLPIGLNTEPTAPTASIQSSMRASESLHLRRDISMLSDRCAHPNCQFFTSVHTHPFCHEHVKHGMTSSAAVPVDPSMTNSRCLHAGCANQASRFIYPYCYEHIDRKIVDNALKERQNTHHTPPEPSMTMIGCRQLGCQNMSSHFIYPYCYEHVESRIATGEPKEVPFVEPIPTSSEEYLPSMLADMCVYPGCNNRSSVFTFPVCYEHVEYFSSKNRQSFEESQQNRDNMALAGGAHPQFGSQLYAQAMEDIETRTRGVATRCKTFMCPNFGNSRSRGYCHDCFRKMGNS